LRQVAFLQSSFYQGFTHFQIFTIYLHTCYKTICYKEQQQYDVVVFALLGRKKEQISETSLHVKKRGKI